MRRTHDRSRTRRRVAAAVLGLSVVATCALAQEPKPKPRPYLPPTKETYLRFAAATEMAFRRDVLGVWFPRCVDDENGGFRSNFTRDWKPAPGGVKFSVFQGRMTWVASQVAMRYPDLKETFLPIARHGVAYLDDVLWDKQYGGFYWGLTDEGRISPQFTDGKHLYGMSFCIYGAAAAYQATSDSKALDLAKRGFRWIDEHAHDATNGGYHEWLRRDGSVVAPTAPIGKVDALPAAGFPIGFKSMNTHIHLLESFTQLYEVWKDDTLRARLEELLAIVRDRITVEPGAMGLYFTPDWRAVPDHDSYGHDVETAYLLLEASEALGHPNDTKTERIARALVDHALAYGWDEEYGGLCREGTSFGRADDTTKEWWEQVEMLNVLLLMHEKYGITTDVYFRDFQREWQFIDEEQTDTLYRGLFMNVKRDGTAVTFDKANIWKGAYHDGRALMNVMERLHRLAGEP